MLPAFVPPCREVSGSHNSQAEAFKEIPGSHHPGFQNSKESTFWELYCGKKSGQSLPFVDLDAQGIFPSTTQERQEAWSSWTAGELCSLNTNHGAPLDICTGCSTRIIQSSFLWCFQMRKLSVKTACPLRPKPFQWTLSSVSQASQFPVPFCSERR